MAGVPHLAFHLQDQAHVFRSHGISGHRAVLEAEFHGGGVRQHFKMQLLSMEKRGVAVLEGKGAGGGIKAHPMLPGPYGDRPLDSGETDAVMGGIVHGQSGLALQREVPLRCHGSQEAVNLVYRTAAHPKPIFEALQENLRRYGHALGERHPLIP